MCGMRRKMLIARKRIRKIRKVKNKKLSRNPKLQGCLLVYPVHVLKASISFFELIWSFQTPQERQSALKYDWPLMRD